MNIGNLMKNIEAQLKKAIEGTQSAEDQEISTLSESAQQSERKKNEERLIWSLCVLILLNVCLLKDCETWTFPVLIGVFELMLIVLLGQTLRVSFFKILMDKILDSFWQKQSLDTITSHRPYFSIIGAYCG